MGSKAEITRIHILRHALTVLKEGGIQGFTLGTVARQAGMSKSGILTRFGCHEQLLREAIGLYRLEFYSAVISPSYAAPPGLRRLEAIFAHAGRACADSRFGRLHRMSFDTAIPHPSAAHDEMATIPRDCRVEIRHCLAQAIRQGELAPGVGLEQLAFEVFGLLMLHLDQVVLQREGEDRPRALLALERLFESRRLVRSHLRIGADHGKQARYRRYKEIGNEGYAGV